MTRKKISSLNLVPGSSMLFNMGKKTQTVFLAVFLLMTVSLQLASAQSSQTVALLDLGKVLADSLAMKSVNLQVKEMEQKLRAEGVEGKNRLKQEQEELTQQRVILSPAIFDQKKKAFNAKASEFRKKMQSMLKQIALSRSAAVNKIEKKMEPIVSKIAKSVGATMIIEKKQILFGEKSLEITQQVISELNATLKDVPVTLVPMTR
ncbi:MAG: OmpH family outer membrane protein [Sneathiella sp.]|nr:OmpH family outer membrane protein [Sneathiella sp.]